MNNPANKLPSFPFYPKDWLTDIKVQALTFEEKGVYLELLSYTWLDEIPANSEFIARLLRCDKRLIDAIISNFFENKSGFLSNNKQEKIKKDILEHQHKMSVAGKKGNERRWHKGQKKAENSSIAKQSLGDTLANRKTSPAFAFASALLISKDIAKEKPSHSPHSLATRLLIAVTGLTFDNTEQQTSCFSRYGKASSSLKGYTKDQILLAMTLCICQGQKLDYTWTLETVAKKINTAKIALDTGQKLESEMQQIFNQLKQKTNDIT